MSRQDLFARALAALDEAALDDSRWPATTGLLDEVCGTSGSSLAFSTGGSRKETKIFFARICVGGERREDLEREYFEVYYPQDEAVPRLRALPDGNLVHFPDLYTEKEKKTSLAYNEFLLYNRIQNSVNVRMTVPQESRVYWYVLRRKDSDGWKSDQIQMIERLLPHVGRFVQLTASAVRCPRIANIALPTTRQFKMRRHSTGLARPDRAVERLRPESSA